LNFFIKNGIVLIVNMIKPMPTGIINISFNCFSATNPVKDNLPPNAIVQPIKNVINPNRINPLSLNIKVTAINEEQNKQAQ
jgi:hypothetical protein